jgi:hypothetical protein
LKAEAWVPEREYTTVHPKAWTRAWNWEIRKAGKRGFHSADYWVETMADHWADCWADCWVEKKADCWV